MASRLGRVFQSIRLFWTIQIIQVAFFASAISAIGECLTLEKS